ncbi:endonuclease/exonuclease/phosphatase family protein [Embleya sp. NPDC055664]
MRARLLLLAVLALCLVPGFSATAAQSPTTGGGPALHFLQYNICGGWSGCTEDPSIAGEVTRRVAKVEQEITSWNSDAVFLSEVCGVQFETLLAELRPRGYTGVFHSQLDTGSGCRPDNRGGTHEGIAVLVKGPVGPGTFHNLTTPGTTREQFGLLCTDTALRDRRVHVCSGHPSPEDVGVEQNRRLAAIVDAVVRSGTPVIVGGDLNLTPEHPGLDGMYSHTGGHGRFVEVDDTNKAYYTPNCPPSAAQCRSGAPTFATAKATPIKLDYVFVSAAHFVDRAGTVTGHDPTITDHDALRGQATWAPTST